MSSSCSSGDEDDRDVQEKETDREREIRRRALEYAMMVQGAGHYQARPPAPVPAALDAAPARTGRNYRWWVRMFVRLVLLMVVVSQRPMSGGYFLLLFTLSFLM